MFLACEGKVGEPSTEAPAVDTTDCAPGEPGCDAEECPPGTLGCGCYGNATCDVAADGTTLVCKGTVCEAFTETSESCPVGDQGCKCLPNGTCNADSAAALVCQGEICTPVDPSCPAGDLGCTCYPNATCNLDEDGAPLRCQGQVCVSPKMVEESCPTGELGCPCFPNASCGQAADGTTLECVETTCQEPQIAPGGCQTGTLGCPCFGNASCYAGPQGQPLVCEGTTCVIPEPTVGCTEGDLDCACYPNATCNVGPAGEVLVCIDATCSLPEPGCQAGTLGCTCTPGGACGQGLTCLGLVCVQPPEQPEECEPGTLWCPCAPAGTCGPGLTCEGTVCVEGEPPCPVGDLGCPCYGNGTCNPGPGGQTLTCNGTTCAVAEGDPGPCDFGALGCPCEANGACGTSPDGKPLTCVGVTCEIDESASPCTPGDLYCGCKSSGECDGGLVCGPTNKCIVPTCPTGALGCACAAPAGDGACLSDTNFCDTDGTCQSLHCERGQAGCGCEPDGTCGGGLGCQLGVCVFVEDLGPVPPEDPDCYTPCSAGRVAGDGTWIPCDDGLMDGCLGGQVCHDGSCVPAAAPPVKPACDDDTGCPSFQACIMGGCYSNCEVDSQCNPGHVCAGKTCKKACTTTGGECPTGSVCESEDGATGVCVLAPSTPPVASGPDVSAYRFEVGAGVLMFDSMLTDTQVAITNHGPTAAKFVIRKLQHSFYASEGFQVVDENALAWLEMGQFLEEVGKAQTFEMVIPGHDGEEPGMRQLKLANAGGSSLVSWDGVLEIEGFVQSKSIGKRRLRLMYRGEPDGIWTGQMIFFANFGDTGLRAWVDGPDGNYGTADDRYATDEEAGHQKVQQIQNAFVKRWIALKQGDISADEFAALLQQTIDGSWSWNNVKSRCPTEENPDYGQGCYLYDDPNVDTDSGVVPYSASLDIDPIPTGGTSLPISLHLEADPDDAGLWQGRIESATAMHYPGNPALSLTFQGDPTGCDNANPGKACLAYFDGMTSAIVAGGRYQAVGGSCPDGVGFQIHSTPWLLEDFVPSHVAGSGLAQQCVYTQLPFGDSQLVVGANKAITAAMPVPNGRALTRTLRLIDGAMVNQREILILFEETVSNPFSDGFGDRLSTYGVMVLQRGGDAAGPDDFVGSDQSELAPNAAQEPTGKLDLQCSAEVLDELADAIPGLSPEERQAVRSNAFTIDKGLVKKVALASVAGTAALLEDASTFCENGDCAPPSNTGWTAHYFCEETGLINGGPDPDNPIPCPHGSNVVYFATRGHLGGLGDRMQELPCQANQLQSVLQFTPHEPEVDFAFSEAWCLDQGSDICEKNAQDVQSDTELGSFISLSPAADGARGTCGEQLEEWQSQLPPGIDEINFDVVFNCYDPSPSTFEMGSTFCDANRYDLLGGKTFIQVPPDVPTLNGLARDIRDAFRYKTKFTNRDGTSLGFSPEVCQFGVTKGEYCYAPADIDLIRQRVDCATHLYTDHFEAMAPVADTVRARVRAYLQNVFGKQVKTDHGIQHSFERLYADLLLTLGDDGYTAAFAGRFDLVGEATATFPGAKFEQGGIDLTGGPGHEMVNLYSALQYYDLILGRFYQLAPSIKKAVQDPAIMAQTWVTPDTVVRYMDRVVRASAQKALAVSEIGRRYHAFYQHELARRVVERGYHATYLESMLITGMMNDVIGAFSSDATFSASVAQLRVLLENTQRKYTQGLLRMRDLRADLDLDVTYFGYPPKYIPFPGLSEGPTFNSTNAVQQLLETARDRAGIAAQKEDAAIAKDKAFATDQAALEKELLELRASYQDRLQELCGTFEGDDGNVYPATSTYADLSAVTRETQKARGDICGYMGSGEISLRKNDLARADVQMRRVQLSQDNLRDRVNIERQRVSQHCGELLELSDFKIETGSKTVQLSEQMEGYKVVAQVTQAKVDWEGEIQAMTAACGNHCNKCEDPTEMQLWMNERHPDWVAQGTAACAAGSLPGLASLGMCDPGGMNQAKVSCPFECNLEVYKCKIKQTADLKNTVPYLAEKFVESIDFEVKVTGPPIEKVLAAMAKEKTGEFQAMKVAEMGWESKNQCDLAIVDSNAVTREIVLEMKQLELDAVAAAQERGLVAADIDGLYREVRDVEADLAEAEQATLNVAAAKNDPSMRIYKNSAIVTADRTFQRALRAAYKLTRVYEYYTSQSYAYLGDLFLVRMVQYGDNTLEQYLDELEDAFYEFEELYGKPDLRVASLSLKDDIFRIPHTVGDLSCGGATPSNTCTVRDRAERFRGRLLDAKFIDENGHIVIPFSTSVDELSPLTRNHKIYSLQVELTGTDLGDHTGRVYLRQAGRSAVSRLEGGSQEYDLPERTGVIDAWFNGHKPLAPDVYESWRFRERPYANSQWELVINTVDEPANEDLNLDGLRDIRLYIYYTDFTVL